MVTDAQCPRRADDPGGVAAILQLRISTVEDMPGAACSPASSSDATA
jgi:hypothetical protein